MRALRLTNSEMGTWRDCKRKWYWGQRLGLRQRDRPPAGAASDIGTRVHAALAVRYDPVTSGDPLIALHAKIESDVIAHPDYEETIRKEADLCDAMVSGYGEWLEETGADQDLIVIASEAKLEVEMRPGVMLLSKLDTRVERRSTGERLALEFKTVGDLTSPLPMLQLDTQLLTEHLVEFLLLRESGEEGARAQGVLYRMLRKVKRTSRANPPFYGEEQISHSLDELRNHWKHVSTIADEILAAHAAFDAGADPQPLMYPSPCRDCTWKCPFLGACKLYNASGDIEGYLAEFFEARDPLERYNVTEEADAT